MCLKIWWDGWKIFGWGKALASPVKFQKVRRKEAHTHTDTPVSPNSKARPQDRRKKEKVQEAPKKKAAHQERGELLLPPASCLSTTRSLIPRSAMASPAEETPAAEDTASPPPPPPARSRGFWFLGEDKSVHKALGGGKSMSLFSSSCALFCFWLVDWLLHRGQEFSVPLRKHDTIRVGGFFSPPLSISWAR